MRYRSAISIAAAFVSGVASAAEESPHTLSANVSLNSQYIFRGLAQTNEDPALQGGLDYGYAPAGFYAGVWASNISWLKENASTAAGVAGTYRSGASAEIDIYGGFKGDFAALGAKELAWDVGALYYWYPGDLSAAAAPLYNIRANTLEVYGGVGWKWLSGKISYSVGDTFGVDDAGGSWYLDLGASVPLWETGLTLGLHWGYQKYAGTDPRIALGGFVAGTDNDALFGYQDWRVSLAYDLAKAHKALEGGEIGVMVTGTLNAEDCGYGSFSDPCARIIGGGTGVFPRNIADDKVMVWVKKSF